MAQDVDTLTSPAPIVEEDVAVADKPVWRGWLHFIFAPTILVGGLILLVMTPGWVARLGLAIYLLSAVVMFGNSAAYHRGRWTPTRKLLFRRLDHSFIFTFIAGTYTALGLTVLHGTDRLVVLILVWSCATVGLLFRIFWITAPRALYVAAYVAMGGAAVGWLPAMWHNGGPALVILVLVGGLIYVLGAVAYGLKKPNPWPHHFGFHEIFHACTILAALCHFAAIVIALVNAR